MLTSDPIAAEVKKAAEKVASKAGEGFEVTDAQMREGNNRNATYKGRVGYGVYASNYEAMRAEAEHKALSMAVQSCR